MNSSHAPYSRRGLRLFLGVHASLPAYFDQLALRLIATGFLLIASPSLFAQTNDNTATVGGRIAGQSRTPALPGNATMTVGLRFDNHSIFGSAVSPKAGLNLMVTDYWRIRASCCCGFCAPDLGQLFYRFLNPISRLGVFSAPWTTSPTAATRMWSRRRAARQLIAWRGGSCAQVESSSSSVYDNGIRVDL